MSAAPLGDGNKLFKGAIRQYFVESLLQDLRKLHMLTTDTELQVRIQNEITEIQKGLEQITNFLVAIDEWENKVFDRFSKIKRCISRKMGDDSRRDMVLDILAEIKELKNLAPNIITLKPVEETHYKLIKPLKRGKFEVGESSNSVKDTNSKKNDGSLEKINVQQMEFLRSLAIFPEKTELKKSLLTNWWIGLGLLPFKGDTSATENQSVDIFYQLEEMNILKPKRVREHNKVVDSYTINPTIHKQFISDLKKEKRIIESEETKGLLLYKNHKDEVVAVLNLDKMHLSNYINIEPTIKVVQLGEWRYKDLEVHNMNKETIHDVAGTKFLENMGEAVTYLSLRGISRIKELPQSIGKMRGLKILDLKDCHSLQKLPQKPKPKITTKIRVGVNSDDGWFKELKHLDITGCYLLYHLPKWVCELSNLQVLKGAVFNGFIPESEEQSQLKDLKKLQKLIKLSIKIIHPHRLSHDDCTGLQHLSNLLVLTITWGRCGTSEQVNSVSVDQDVVTEKQSRENSRSKMLGGTIKRDKKKKEKKQRKQSHGENEDGMKTRTIYFPKNLEKLDIRCYPNAEAPELSNAAKLQNLKRLYIRGGKLVKFGNDVDWQVETLRLRFLKFFELPLHELHAKFTKLKCFKYKACPGIRFYGAGHFGPFKDDEPVPDEYSERVMLSLAYSYIDKQDRGIAKLVSRRRPAKSIWDIVMVLDVRRSMEGEKLAIMKTAVLSFIKKLTDDPSLADSYIVRLSIVTFGIDTKGWPLCLITENRPREIKNLINSFAADGSVSASDGLQMGLKVLKDRWFSVGHVPTILLVSGSNNIGDAAEVPTGDVTIDTVGIGNDCDRKVLESIAANNKGRFTHVRNTSDELLFYLPDVPRYYNDHIYHGSSDDVTLTLKPGRGAPIMEQLRAGTYQACDHNTIRVDFADRIEVKLILPHYSDVAEIRCSYRYRGVHRVIEYETYWEVYCEGFDVKLTKIMTSTSVKEIG